MGNLTTIALTAAILSSMANVGQAWAYLNLRDELTRIKQAANGMTQERDLAQLDAAACGNAVDELANLAAQRAKEVTAARATAATQARAAAQRADAILSAPAAVPGNDCQSAQVRVDAWLQTRALQ